MSYFFIGAIFAVMFVFSGCGSAQDTSSSGEYSAGETFVAAGEKGQASGFVRVEEVAGIPQLTVDVYGAKQ